MPFLGPPAAHQASPSPLLHSPPLATCISPPDTPDWGTCDVAGPSRCETKPPCSLANFLCRQQQPTIKIEKIVPSRSIVACRTLGRLCTADHTTLTRLWLGLGIWHGAGGKCGILSNTKVLADGFQHRLSAGYQLGPFFILSAIDKADASYPDRIGGNRFRVFSLSLNRHEGVGVLTPSHRQCCKLFGYPPIRCTVFLRYKRH